MNTRTHGEPARRRGFTIIELLLVISLVMLLIALAVPGLTAARRAAQGIQCEANLKQISTACLIYINESKEYFPFPNSLTMESTFVPPDPRAWRGAGWLYLYPNNAQPTDRHAGIVWGYLQNDAVFRCPADKGPWSLGPTQNLTSYMMSTVLRGFDRFTAPSVRYSLFRTDGVFMWEANEDGPADTYNDGNNDPVADSNNNQGVARRHNFCGSVACFDGHVEMMNTQQYYLESLNSPGRLWCYPDSLDGH